MKNIVLIGFKKSGKTTLGYLLSKKLNKRFIDVDLLIEKLYFVRYLEKKTCFAIVRGHAESFFRALEKEAIQSLEKEEGAVIATGGGTLLLEESANILKKNGFFVFLDAPLDLLEKRIRMIPSFLNEKPMDLLFEERRKIYLQWADFQVDTAKKNKEEIVKEIIGGLCGKQ